MRYVTHALDRLRERGITEEDVELALRRPEGVPLPGSGLGNVVVTGRAKGGRQLKVVRSATEDLVITAYWGDS